MSASISVDLTQSQLLAVLRSALITILPTGIEVVLGDINRVPEPAGADFVVMTPTGRVRLATNVTLYTDGAFATPPVPGTRTDQMHTQLSIQLDVHGPNSADSSQVITTLLRSSYATDVFANTGYDIAPLYTGEPTQAPFLNAEQQLEYRWMIEIVIQANLNVTTPQDFAASLHVGLYDYI